MLPGYDDDGVSGVAVGVDDGDGGRAGHPDGGCASNGHSDEVLVSMAVVMLMVMVCSGDADAGDDSGGGDYADGEW